jgi:hypothetical protein
MTGIIILSKLNITLLAKEIFERATKPERKRKEQRTKVDYFIEFLGSYLLCRYEQEICLSLMCRNSHIFS